MKMKLKILINFYPRCPTVSWVKLLLINSFCDTINVNMLTYKRGKRGRLTIARWLKPRSLACISVMMMTVPSVWNLIKDSSYLYWHSLPASDWSRPCPAGLPLAGGWHLCAPIVWLRVAQSWIKLWLAWPGHPGFYLQFYSPHCLGHPAPGQQDIRRHLVPWYTFISTALDDVWSFRYLLCLLISSQRLFSLSHLVPTTH